MDNKHFKELITVNMNAHVKKLQSQSYISWVDQWAQLKKLYPNASYQILENSDGLPYFASKIGIFVKVSVTIEGETITEVYPVLNSANKALKEESYTYQVKEYVNRQATGKMIEKRIDAVTTFDINTSIKRCLAKCIALHGLGLYIYRDETMPEVELISSDQLHEITNLCSELNVSLKELSTAFIIKTPSEFHATTFESAIQWIKDNAKNNKSK